MFEKVKAFYPPLRKYGDEDVEDVLVGLRPARKGNFRWIGIQCVLLFCITMDTGVRACLFRGAVLLKPVQWWIALILKGQQIYLSKLWTVLHFFIFHTGHQMKKSWLFERIFFGNLMTMSEKVKDLRTSILIRDMVFLLPWISRVFLKERQKYQKEKQFDVKIVNILSDL